MSDSGVVFHKDTQDSHFEPMGAWRQVDVEALQSFDDFLGVKLRSVELSRSGPTLLFLHGIGNSLNLWLPSAAELSDRYRSILLDLPGFGQSSGSVADTHIERVGRILEVFIDRHDDGNGMTIVGHSMGALVSAHMATLPSLPITRVINVSGPPITAALAISRPTELLGSTKGLAVLGAMGAGIVPLKSRLMPHLMRGEFTRNLFLGRFVSKKHQVTPELAELMFSDLGNGKTFGATQNSLSYDPEVSYQETLVPVQVVLGDEDPLMSTGDAHQYIEYAGGGRIDLLEGVGHLPMIERPRLFESLIDEAVLGSPSV